MPVYPGALWLYLSCQWQPESACPGRGEEAEYQGKEERWLTIFLVKITSSLFSTFLDTSILLLAALSELYSLQ